jgi:O-antigen ligase
VALHPGAGGIFVILAIAVLCMRSIRSREGRPHALPYELKILIIVSALYSFGFFVHDIIINRSFAGAYAANKANFIFPLLASFFALLWRCGMRLDVGRLAHHSMMTSFFLAIAAVAALFGVNFSLDGVGQMLRDSGVVMGDRFQFYARNPLMFATLYLGVTFVALVGLEKQPPFRKVVCLVMLLIAPIVLYFAAQARGAMIAYVLLLIFSGAFIRVPRLTLAVVGVVLILVMIGLLSFYEDVFISGRGIVMDNDFSSLLIVPTLIEADSSIRIRLEMYSGGVSAFMQNPLIGFGYQMRFDAVFGAQSTAEIGHHGHLHNVFVNHLVAGGLLGGFLWMLLWLLPLWSLLRAKVRSGDAWFLGGVFVLLVFGVGMTTEVTGHYVHTLFLGMLLGLVQTSIAMCGQVDNPGEGSADSLGRV